MLLPNQVLDALWGQAEILIPVLLTSGITVWWFHQTVGGRRQLKRLCRLGVRSTFFGGRIWIIMPFHFLFTNEEWWVRMVFFPLLSLTGPLSWSFGNWTKTKSHTANLWQRKPWGLGTEGTRDRSRALHLPWWEGYSMSFLKASGHRWGCVMLLSWRPQACLGR